MIEERKAICDLIIEKNLHVTEESFKCKQQMKKLID